MLSYNASIATHLRGAEIRYAHLSGNTYHIQLHQYTSIASPIDYHEAVYFLNGIAIDTLDRDSVFEVNNLLHCGSGMKVNYFNTEYTFPSPGNYVITFEDPNRNGSILNIPNSINQSLCVSATLVISPTTVHNNSVIFENPQYIIDPYYMNGQYSWFMGHSLDAYDADGDSLSFEAVIPGGNDCDPILGYAYPDASFSVDPMTGEWQFTATIMGEYVIAIRATEWRDGQMIGQITRDMSICAWPQVGLEELKPSHFSLTPTMTNGPIMITSSFNSKVQIRIFSLSGSLVMEDFFNGRSQLLNLGSLENGLYLVQLQEPDGPTTSVRVIKH